MSELDVFGFIGVNRSVFSTLFLCGVLMPLSVVIVAYFLETSQPRLGEQQWYLRSSA